MTDCLFLVYDKKIFRKLNNFPYKWSREKTPIYDINSLIVGRRTLAMNELKENLKKYVLIKYAQAKLNECNHHLSKSIPWIQRKSLANTIETHCRVLLNTLINESGKQSFRRNKYIIDSILKYTLGRSENLLKSNKKAKDIKSYMQLNSYIVYDEIKKGLESNKNKKAIRFNIEKQLSDIQEKIDSKVSLDEILLEKIK